MGGEYLSCLRLDDAGFGTSASQLS